MKNKTKHSLIMGFTLLLGIIGQTVFTSVAVAVPAVDHDQASEATSAGIKDSRVGTERKHIVSVETQGLDTVLDIPLRLGGFAATVVGTGFFIGTSPITGLMTALYPHNAIQKAADFLVVRPGRYTFVRPTGDFSYDSRSSDEK